MSIRQSTTWQYLANIPFLRHFTLHAGLFCIVLLLNVLSNGFDLGVYNVIQAMDPFQNRFGDVYHPEKGGYFTISTAHLSMLNSIPLVSFAVAVYVASVIGEQFGRRVVYLIMNFICLIGVGVTWSATSFGQILAGRMIVQAYVGFESWLIPLFLAEMVPRAVRGTLVSCYMFTRLLGTLTISCICFSTSSLGTDAAWRIPVTSLFAIPSLALLLFFLVPESPRWLLRRGQQQKALKWLRYMNQDKSEDEIQYQLALLAESLEADKQKGSWAELFQGTNRYRTYVALLGHFFALASGQAFVNMYATVFIKSLGTVNPFIMTVVSQSCGIVGSLLFVSFVDRLGRRFFWLTAAPMAALAMIAIGVLGTLTPPTRSTTTAIAAMFPVFGFFYLGSMAQIAALTPAEIPSLKLRDKTAMAAWSVQNLTNFITSFTAPYLIDAGYANLGARVGFIYGAFAAIAVVWAYFYYPELTGRSLEEIDEMLRQGIGARETKAWSAPAGSLGQRLNDLELDNPAKKEVTEAHVENA